MTAGLSPTALVSNPLAMGACLTGTAQVPGDKSISHRSLMIGAIADGVTEVTGMLEGEDVLCTARALMSLGATVTPPSSTGGTWRIKGVERFRQPRAVLYLGNSGTSARLLMGLAGGQPITATFTGDESLMKRPMGRVIKPLSMMGINFETGSAGDRLPLRLSGAAMPAAIDYALPVPSAQVKSAILLASLRAQGETIIREHVPTRDHTERMLRYFGHKLSIDAQKDGSVMVRMPGNAILRAKNISVPADPSSAAFVAVAALITPGSDVLIENMCVNPLRMGLYETLIEMGANIKFENERLVCGETVADMRVKSSRLKGVTVPASRVASMIDEFPILSVAGAYAEGKTGMAGLAELKVKESDRLTAIAQGLHDAGVALQVDGDSLSVIGKGHGPKGGCLIKAQLDHRIAMSFLVLGMGSAQPVTIDDGATIGTSFPGFVKLMNGLGANIADAASVAA